MSSQREGIRAQCETIGVPGARALLAQLRGIPDSVGWVEEWIDETLRKEAAAREEAQRILSEKALAAAQRAAETSAIAAKASSRSALWTMIAALIAGASTLITAGLAIAQYMGWMPK
jgi:hypothetical protein